MLVVCWLLPTPLTKFAHRPNAISLPTEDTLRTRSGVYHLYHFVYIYLFGAELTSCHCPAQFDSAQQASFDQNILNFNPLFRSRSTFHCHLSRPIFATRKIFRLGPQRPLITRSSETLLSLSILTMGLTKKKFSLSSLRLVGTLAPRFLNVSARLSQLLLEMS